MHTALYMVWFAIPGFFLLTALWAFLEHTTNRKGPKQNPADNFKQFLFVALCVGIAVLIDQTVLPDLVKNMAPDWIPLGFFEVLLLPFVLLLGAKIIGPTKEVKREMKKHS